MLPTSAGVEPATPWSPVGRRIQLSHRGRKNAQINIFLFLQENICCRVLICFLGEIRKYQDIMAEKCLIQMDGLNVYISITLVAHVSVHFT